VTKSIKAVLLLALAGGFWGSSAAEFDLVLRRAHVIDPKNNVDGVRDVGIQGGKVALVAAEIASSRAAKSVDLTGLYLTPGLVDIHVHLYASTGVPDAWAGDNSIYPDGFSFRSGVTTMVDAGTAGWRNFEDFRTRVIDRAKTRVLALINIAGYGMTSNMVEQADFDPEALAKLAGKHKDVVAGVKAAHYELPDWKQIDAAVKAGTLANIPVMVDFGYFLAERPYYQLVTSRLRPGDISTHMYRASVPWVGADGRLHPYLRQARERGVLFDVGHGGGSFVFRNAVPAVAQGFYPDAISTDLHVGSMNAAMMDMPTTMSKFLAMGMPLREVIARSTYRAAEVVRRGDLGHLSVGSPADIAVWRLDKGSFGFADASNGGLRGTQRLFCELTLMNGTVTWDWNARFAGSYQELGPDYGMRPGLDFVVLPEH
jgi:dihydroorotase